MFYAKGFKRLSALCQPFLWDEHKTNCPATLGTEELHSLWEGRLQIGIDVVEMVNALVRCLLLMKILHSDPQNIKRTGKLLTVETIQKHARAMTCKVFSVHKKYLF